MNRTYLSAACAAALLFLFVGGASAAEKAGWLESGLQIAQADPGTAGAAAASQPAASRPAPPAAGGEKPATKPAQAGEGPPLPFHTVEGVSGACLVPMAYMVNAGKPGTIIGKPAVSFTSIFVGSKNVQSWAVTQTFLRRIEFGYAVERFDMGSLPDDVEKATGIRLRHDSLALHNFNLRAMLIEEDSFGLPLPAITAGVHFKYNDSIRSIDKQVGGALSGLGLARSNGVDYTLTATKMVPVFSRPLILSAGMRNSQAAQTGFLGFADHCATTVEGAIVYLPLDWLAIGYEYRQKANPYKTLGDLIGDEDDWHVVAIGLIWKDFTMCIGWVRAGNLANHEENLGYAVQIKYEF